MQHPSSSLPSHRATRRALAQGESLPRLALDEHELAARWRLSVKTLRSWRREQLGPVFCKLGARVIYLIAEIEAFEQRVSRYSTGARAGS